MVWHKADDLESWKVLGYDDVVPGVPRDVVRWQ